MQENAEDRVLIFEGTAPTDLVHAKYSGQAVLRFVPAVDPAGNRQVFLVCDGKEQSASKTSGVYRRRKRWLSIHEPGQGDEWFFGCSDSHPSEYDDLRRQVDTCVPAPLAEAATKWFDEKSDEVEFDELLPFCAAATRFAAQRVEGGAGYFLQIVTDTAIWARNEMGHWALVEVLNNRTRQQRDVLIRTSENLLRDAVAARWQPDDESLREEVATALSIAAPFDLIPTFENEVDNLGHGATSTWTSIRPFLACTAKPVLILDQHGASRELLVIQGAVVWSRRQGTWVNRTQAGELAETGQPIDIRDLQEAVSWWDHLGENSEDSSTLPLLYTDSSMHFVTDDDPFVGGDFQLSDLIRGNIDDGVGWSRNSGAWIRHYIPVLDYENHLPTDEGDLRPWGGQYVWSIPEQLENLALSFWEDLVVQYHFGENDVYWSDFLSWVSNET